MTLKPNGNEVVYVGNERDKQFLELADNLVLAANAVTKTLTRTSLRRL